MARKTRLQSAVQIEANFPDNNAELITPAITREYLLDNIDSTQYLDLTSTRAALQTIQAANGLVLDQWYKITDAATSKVLLIKASSTNTFYPNAQNLTEGGIGRYDIASNVYKPEISVDANDNRFLFDLGSNSFGSECILNGFYGSGGNTFGNNCSINIFEYNSAGNTFGNNCSINIFEYNSAGMTFGNNCYRNQFKISSVSNIFGNNCFRNIFERFTANFTFLSNLQYCTVGEFCNGENTDFTNSAQLYNRATPWRLNKIISADLIEVWFDVNQTSEVRGTYVPSTDVFTAYPAAGGIVANGQNSITLQSVGNSLTNGTNLLAALAAVNALNWGTRSDSNRGAVNLFPGNWDAGSTTIQMFPFIDIVGISTDRKATIIMGSGMVTNQRHIDFNTSNAGLHNLTLIANVPNDALMLGGDAGCFPICENVYFGSDSMFYNNTVPGFVDLDGRFNNCEFKSGIGTGFYAAGNILGTFTNNVFGDVSQYTFYGLELSGKFINNRMGDGNYVFYGLGNLSGLFTGNRFGNFNYAFVSGNSITGNISNNIFGNGGYAFSAINDISATIANNTFGTVGYAFQANLGSITGNIINNTFTGASGAAFYAGIDITGTIRGSSFIGAIEAVRLFTGKLISCRVSTLGESYHSIKNIGDGAVIERCTIKTTPTFDSLFSATPVTPQILYTAMSSINANIANPAGRFNIVDATLV